MADSFDLLAAELAFGLLDDSERCEAERLRSGDRMFAANLVKWHLVAEQWLGELPDHAPSPALWDRVSALIAPSPVAGNDNAIALASSVPGPGLWRPSALAASALACLFAGLWLFHPSARVAPLAPGAAGRFSIAQIGGTGEPQLGAVLYDRDAGTLTIRIAAIASGPARVPELWLLNGAHPPCSLGFAQSGAAIRVQASVRLKRSLVGGATLAITLERVSAHPHAVPGGKFLGTGTISTL